MTTVGVIGLGGIGAGVARSVTAAGLDLAVCDVRPEATVPFASAGTVASTPAELARHSDVVVVAVVTDDQVAACVTGPSGVLGTARAGTVVVIVSTVSPDTVIEVAGAAGRCGVDVVDCGVSGGPSAAAKGELVCMVGGEASVIESIGPVLDAISCLVVRTGGLGTGITTKLARNVVQYGSWLAAYEGQLLAESAGIDLATLATVIRESDKRIGGAAALMLRDTVEPFGEGDDAGFIAAMRAAAGLAHKDLLAALDVARTKGVDLPLAEMTEQRCDNVFGIGIATP